MTGRAALRRTRSRRLWALLCLGGVAFLYLQARWWAAAPSTSLSNDQRPLPLFQNEHFPRSSSLSLKPQNAPSFLDSNNNNKYNEEADLVIRQLSSWEMRSEASWKEEFFREGVVGPFPLLEEEELAFVREAAHRSASQPSRRLPWEKSRFLGSSMLVSLGMHPTLVPRLQALLGPDVLLFGVSVVERGADKAHRWHVDVETRNCKRAATVWMGLENTNLATALMVLTRTHQSGTLPQERVNEYKVLTTNNNLATKEIAEAAKSFDAEAKLVRHDMGDGDFLIFHGQAWHASENPSNSKRQAIILQYMAAECAIRRPQEFNPPYSSSVVLPPVLLVSGWLSEKASKVNNVLLPKEDSAFSTELPFFYRPHVRLSHPYTIVDGNTPRPLEVLKESAILPNPQLKTEQKRGMKYWDFVNHKTPSFDKLEIHLSSQLTYQTPHMPHYHEDEELIYIVAGEVKITRLPLPNKHDWGEWASEEERKMLPEDMPEETIATQGDFIYHPSNVPHTITSLSEPNSRYVCIRFFNEPEEQQQENQNATVLPPLIVSRGGGGERDPKNVQSLLLEAMRPEGPQLIDGKLFLEGRTEMLIKLHSHVTIWVKEGQGFGRHIDAERDGFVIVEEGEVLLIPQERPLYAGDMAYFPAGRPH
ncbi:hypothetical protein QOT17_016342, partial [Balamuthia mandrillaris]